MLCRAVQPTGKQSWMQWSRLARVEAESDFQKEALDELYQKFKIPKRLLARFAKAFHKQNYVEELAVDEDFVYLVETLVKKD